MQADPLKPKLKPPGTNRLKLMCDIPVSHSAFKFNLRRYTKAKKRKAKLDKEAQKQLGGRACRAEAPLTVCS